MQRMLLSHNFNLNNNELPALEREKFAQVFVDGFKEKKNVTCSYIENPHWVVEILFPKEEFEVETIGKMCGEILLAKRKSQTESVTTDTLILGGKKTTPVANMRPNTLQPGEWGVDVVETADSEIFLASINWEILTEDKSDDDIFKFEFRGN